MPDPAIAKAWLIPLPGKKPVPTMELSPAAEKGRSVVIGRSQDCELRLPATAEEVSRCHAEFVNHQGQWGIADLNSRWGTQVNGTKIAPRRLVPLGEGDLVGIFPWTFRFSMRGPTAAGATIHDDNITTILRTITEEAAEPLRQDMLNLLLEASSAVQAAEDEAALATVLTDMARRGTGMSNATLLRVLDAEGNVDAVGGAGGVGGKQKTSPGSAGFSRSLLAAAGKGVVAEFSSAAGGADIAHSIIQSNVQAAICAPLMLGKTVAAFLYVDSRGAQPARLLHPNAAGFCQTLARMGGLALANLKRLEIERRAAHLEAELNAAAAAQRWILPREPLTAGPFTCAGRMRPGGYLGGDFFDAQVLADGRLSVTLGDASGHGADAGVLMTAAQGFLHASLAQHGDLARAMAGLNAFIEERSPLDKFITLWTGLFDPADMSLQYVDAGHGFGLLAQSDGTLQRLNENGGPPVGIVEGFEYIATKIPLQAGQRILIISDGIVEQCGTQAASDGHRRQFELEGVEAAIARSAAGDLIEAIFQSLYDFAGCHSLSDDTTVVVVQW